MSINDVDVAARSCLELLPPRTPRFACDKSTDSGVSFVTEEGPESDRDESAVVVEVLTDLYFDT
jgi:hypothetical protein